MKNIPTTPKGILDHCTRFIASFYLETIEDHINLEICSPQCSGHFLRYYFNPLSLKNEKEREFFPNLQTYWRYKLDDPYFENDEKIKIRKETLNASLNLTKEQRDKLEKLCKMKMKEIVFDSNIHNYETNTSEFDDKILKKENLLFLIETNENNPRKLGGFISSKINEKNVGITDRKAFVFCFQNDTFFSYKLRGPLQKQAFTLFDKSDYFLFEINYSIKLFKKGDGGMVDCIIEEYGLYDDVDGPIGYSGDCFGTNQFWVIQMK